MSEVIKKALTDKTARNADALREVATEQTALIPWTSATVD